MPITLNDDKINIFKILSTDPYIESLGFIARDIMRTKNTTEKIDANKHQIFIYNVPAERSMNRFISNLVYQIDVSTPLGKYNNADLCVEQIIALLDGKDIGGMHRLRLTGEPQALSCPPSNYCIGIRFVCSETKFNRIKTIIEK